MCLESFVSVAGLIQDHLLVAVGHLLSSSQALFGFFVCSKSCSLHVWCFLCVCRRSAILTFSLFARYADCWSLCLRIPRGLISASCFTRFSVLCNSCSASARCDLLCLSNAWFASARCALCCLSNAWFASARCAPCFF